MKIAVKAADITATETPALIVNLFKGVKEPSGATGAVDQALDGAISQLIRDGEIKGAEGETTLVHTLGRMAPERVIVVGLGSQDKFGSQVVRRVTADVLRFLRRRGVDNAVTVAHGAGTGGLGAEEAGQAIAEGAVLGLYQFGRYQSKNGDEPTEFGELTIAELNEDRSKAVETGVDRGMAMANGTLLARDMVNEPANVMTPTSMAEAAQKWPKQAGWDSRCSKTPR